jgi:hypothetical protein
MIRPGILLPVAVEAELHLLQSLAATTAANHHLRRRSLSNAICITYLAVSPGCCISLSVPADLLSLPLTLSGLQPLTVCLATLNARKDIEQVEHIVATIGRFCIFSAVNT